MTTRTVLGDLQATFQQHLQGVEWSLNGTVSMVLRRWRLVGLVALGVVALAVGLLLITPPRFTAETTLQINSRAEQVTNVEDVVSGLSATDATIRTELEVIQSRKLAGRVIKKIPELQDNQSGGIFTALKNAVGYFIAPLQTVEEAQAGEDAAQTRAINAFLDNLEVSMIPRSYGIKVEFTAANPELAAKVANTLANEYLVSQLEDKFDATQRANAWMNTRIKELQSRLQTSERAVQLFMEERGLTRALGVTLTEQQISELNSQLILARTKLAEAEARVSSGERAVGSTSEVLNNPLIQNLSLQETQVRRTMSDLASKYGARHPRMVTVRQELANVQRKIAEETAKIRGSLGNDLEMAKARVKTLEEQLAALQTQTSAKSDDQVQLAELERQAQAERSLYENFLNRSKEIAQMDFQQADARIISAAETPLQPSFPNKKLVLALALLLGLSLGVGLALLLEALDSGIRTTSQLENLLGVPALGMLGELPGDTLERAFYVANKPTGAFTESLRSIRTALKMANPDKTLRIIATTSSVPQEGKSLFTISSAQQAALAGQKVLLIDADLRRPSIAKQLGIEAKAGLAEVLSGGATFKQAVHKLKQTGLDVLPSLPDNQFAQELLGSKKMAELLTDLKKTYDVIYLDCPPIMAVADAITVGQLADAMVFMARWGTTPRPLMVNAVKQLQAGHAPLSGVVLSRVDLEKQQAYGYGDYGYYYGKYKDYYSN